MSGAPRLRVLHLDTGREMRGGQWQVLHLVERAGGTLLAPADSPLLDAACALGLEARPLGWFELLRRARAAEIVHAHDARAHTLAAIAGCRALVVSRRVAFAVRTSWVSREKYRRPRRYIAISRAVRAALEAAGVPASKIDVVYDGVPVPEQASTLPGGRALALASRDPGKLSGLLREAASLAGLEIDFSSDLPRDLARASVFLYASCEEGLGSAALLAMAAGVPVVASRVGGLPEIVSDGETGWLVDNTAPAFAEALRRALSSPATLREFGARARRSVIEQFSVDAMASGTLAVYERMMR